jgi:hypothetical protein
MTAPNTPNSARNAMDFSPFGPPQLIEGEDIAHYDELFARVTAAVKPADVIEEIRVCDFVDLECSSLAAPACETPGSARPQGLGQGSEVAWRRGA